MKKVLLISDDLANGGAERQLTLLAKYLPGNWERQIWSMSHGPYDEINRSNGIIVNIFERRNRFDISPSINLWKKIKTYKPDIVHSWGWMSTAAAIPACRRYKIPLIDGTIRLGVVAPKRGNINKFIMRFADRIIANSEAGLKAYKIENVKGRVVYNGFDPDRLPLCKKEPNNYPHKFTVIMTGRMSKEKDFLSFINVAKALSNNSPDSWLFYALGGGVEREKIMSAGAELIKKGILVMPEPGIEVLDYVRKSDVGLLLTNQHYHAEGCSNSIMEYMACGLPVICTDSGGNSEIVENNKNGYLIQNNDISEIISRIDFLHENPVICDRMGYNNRINIANEFSIEKLIKSIVEIYQELL